MKPTRGRSAWPRDRKPTTATDGAAAVLRVLTEHRDDLVRTRTQTVNRLHSLAGAENPRSCSKRVLVMVAPRSFVLVERVEPPQPPAASNGAVSRVATVNPIALAMLAISASKSPIAWPWERPLEPEGRRRRWLAGSSKAKVRPWNRGTNSPSNRSCSFCRRPRGQAGDAVTYLGQANRRQVQGLDRLGVQPRHDTRTRSRTRRLGITFVSRMITQNPGAHGLSFRARSPSPRRRRPGRWRPTGSPP